MSNANHHRKAGLGGNSGGREGRASLFGAHPPPSRGSRIYDPDVRLREVRAQRAKRRGISQRPPKGWTDKFLVAMGLNSPHRRKGQQVIFKGHQAIFK